MPDSWPAVAFCDLVRSQLGHDIGRDGAQVPADGGAELLWTQSRGPKVPSPARRDFGSLVIERNLARAVETEIERGFTAEGLRCRIAIPVSGGG